MQRLKTYTRPELLILDDPGFEEIEITQAGNANLLLKVVNAGTDQIRETGRPNRSDLVDADFSCFAAVRGARAAA